MNDTIETKSSTSSVTPQNKFRTELNETEKNLANSMKNSSLLSDDEDSYTNSKDNDVVQVATTVTTTTETSQFLETSFDETVVTRTENADEQINTNGIDVSISESSIANTSFKAVALYDYQACK